MADQFIVKCSGYRTLYQFTKIADNHFICKNITDGLEYMTQYSETDIKVRLNAGEWIRVKIKGRTCCEKC